MKQSVLSNNAYFINALTKALSTSQTGQLGKDAKALHDQTMTCVPHSDHQQTDGKE